MIKRDLRPYSIQTSLKLRLIDMGFCITLKYTVQRYTVQRTSVFAVNNVKLLVIHKDMRIIYLFSMLSAPLYSRFFTQVMK